MNSIKLRIFISSFLLSSIVFLTVSLFIYSEVKKFVFEALDDTLHSKMQLLVGLLHEEKNKIEFELTEIKGGEYSIVGSGHYYKVLIEGQKNIVSPSLDKNNFDFKITENKIIIQNEDEKIFNSIGILNEKTRVLEKDFDFIDKKVKIIVAESTEESIVTLDKIQHSIYLFTILGVSVLCLFSFLISKKSLEPIDNLAKEISSISHRNLNIRIKPKKTNKELASLIESFNNMLERINKAFETEKFIISEASHQLKTPIAVIRSNCDITLKKDRSIEDYKEVLLDIKETSVNMSKQINDMLLLAKLDSGNFKTEDFKQIGINKCINKAIEISKTFALKNNIKVSFLPTNKKVEIWGNEEKLTEAFLNIIENGIKYNKINGKVDILVENNNNTIKIFINDTGNGIPEKDLPNIFERFYRSRNIVDIEGTGLGLSIVKSIVELHDGTINVESSENKGTSFIISFIKK